MGYQHGKTGQPAGGVLTVEQTRRRHAQLRLELADLAREGAHLEAQAALMRETVSAARKKLTRQIREADAARAQAERIASTVEQHSTLPAPVYGGREGLQAAADEIEAYEAKPGAKLGTVRRRNPRHGTGRLYATGCRCEDCMGWRKKRTDQEVARQQKRRAELQALRAEVAA